MPYRKPYVPPPNVFSRLFRRATHPWLVFVMLVTLVIAGATLGSFTYHIQALRLSGEVMARSVTFQVTEVNGLDVAEDVAFTKAGLSLREAYHVETSGGAAPAMPGGSLDLRDAAVILTKLHMARGGWVTLAHRGNGFEIDLWGADGVASLEAPDPAEDGAARLITVTVNGTDTVPVVLRGELAEPIELDDLGAANLRFGQRRPGMAADHPFLSSISCGHLTVEQSGQTHQLAAGMPFVMNGFAGTLVRLQTEAAGVHLWFSGHATAVTLGTLGDPEDVTPTWLDVLNHQQRLTFIWAGVVAAIGLLANLVQWHSWRDAK